MPPKPSERPPAVEPPGPVLVGWKERLDFPEWGLRRIRVKVDTGACTSALDVAGWELYEADGGGLAARLRLALDRRHPGRVTEVDTPVVRMAVVSNTGGTREQRPVVEAAVRLGPVRKRIQVTLTRRPGLRFRMILGRRALAGSFIVDVSRKYLLR